jgi:glucoamylase
MNSPIHDDAVQEAPGAPGIPPTWSSSAKEMVGCAFGPSRIWFTIGGGIVNEVYYPRIDIPQIRDLGFVIANGKGFWVELKRLESHVLHTPGPGIPLVQLVHRHARFEFALRIAPDPVREVLLLEIRLNGDPSLRPYVLLAPHLGGTGHDNVAAIANYHGRRVLWAEQGPFALALAAAGERQQDAFGVSSAGYVGTSDGWQDFARNGAMVWEYGRAGPGNVALTGTLPCEAVLALAFGSSKESAATLALSALLQPFDHPWQEQLENWQAWHRASNPTSKALAALSEALNKEYLVSTAVLRTHQDKIYPGAMVASLSVPWGNTRDERGGYHLVWPRDMVECAGALLALGAVEEAQEVLRYLIATQHEDGHWYQNQWLGGKPYWQGIQLDEAAFPVLLAAALAQRNALDGIEVHDMVRRALGFIARTGPASDQDRWEEDAGVNAFTLAACISALVAGAPFLEHGAGQFALVLADFWNGHIEDWTAAYDTPLARRLQVKGYYVREAPVQTLDDDNALRHVLSIKNRIDDAGLPAEEQVGTDFLQLVRFGLRRANDPLIQDSIRVIDALLKVDTPNGPSWHRYNGDGYGEQADGTPFDGAGVGRAWPLLTGERGHYALAAGDDPLPYLEAMAAMANSSGMISEQIWDAPPVPDRGLFPGRPTGSAMPLAWAHAEFIKLVHSLELGRPFDRPDAVWERYRGQRPQPVQEFWCEHAPIARIRPQANLLICLRAPGMIHWTADSWQSTNDISTRASGLGLHVAELPTKDLKTGTQISFKYNNAETGVWSAQDSSVIVG